MKNPTPPSPVPPTTSAVESGAAETLPPPEVDRLLGWLVVLAVLAGVALRFWPRPDLWLDEALSVNIASLPIDEIGAALRRDGHPPLYYWLLHAWIAVGGAGDWWVRAMSGAISLVALPLAYLAGRRVGARPGAGPLGAHRTGLLALAVMAVLPYGIRYGSEARMYSLTITLVLGGYLLVDNELRAPARAEGRWLNAAGITLVTAALLWSHYWSIWLLCTVGFCVLFIAVRSSDRTRRQNAWITAAAMAMGGLVFAPWLPTMLFQSSHTGTPWGDIYGPALVATETLTEFSGDVLTSYLTVLFAVLAVGATVVVVKGRQRVASARVPSRRVLIEVAVTTATIALGWGIATSTGNTFSPRYAAVVYPLFVLTVATGVALLRGRWSTVFALGALVALSVYVAGSVALTPRSQAGEVATRIQRDATDGRTKKANVIVCPDQIGVALDRALRNRGVDANVIPFPTAGDPRFVDWIDYADRNADADPAAFWAEVSEGIPDDAPIYAVIMPSYKTFDAKCEELLSLVSLGRSQVDRVAPAEDGEGMGLWVLRARP